MRRESILGLSLRGASFLRDLPAMGAIRGRVAVSLSLALLVASGCGGRESVDSLFGPRSLRAPIGSDDGGVSDGGASDGGTGSEGTGSDGSGSDGSGSDGSGADAGADDACATELDVCGVCGGDGQSCLDCAGEVNGEAAIDPCGVCAGGTTGVAACAQDCEGSPGGSAVEDACGVCGGDGSSCMHPLEGRYAARTVAFARQQTMLGTQSLDVISKGILYTLVDIDNTGVVTENYCFIESVSTEGLFSWVEPRYAGSIPASVTTLVQDGAQYVRPGTEDRSFIGWDPALQPADCVTGQMHARGCLCGDTDALPSDPSDCRVLDMEGDGKPGATLQLGLDRPEAPDGVAGDVTLYMANVKQIEWRLPGNASGTLVGSMRGGIQQSELDREGSFATAFSEISNSVCPDRLGHVELVPGNFDCAGLLAGRARDLDGHGIFDAGLDSPTPALDVCPDPSCPDGAIDQCGVCDGDDSSCADACGVPNGDGTTCQDCSGTAGGTASLDRCNVCVGGTTGLSPCVQDCNDEWGGVAVRDQCGLCVGGGTGAVACVRDCNNDWGGSAAQDSCGICAGGNTGVTACVEDCNGVTNGTAVVDACGTCVGGNTGLTACARDCNGVDNGAAFVDQCGTCVDGNTGLTACVQDCNSEWGGSAVRDQCGACVDGSTGAVACVQDCAGTWGGSAVADACGECGGDGSTCQQSAADALQGTYAVRSVIYGTGDSDGVDNKSVAYSLVTITDKGDGSGELTLSDTQCYFISGTGTWAWQKASAAQTIPPVVRDLVDQGDGTWLREGRAQELGFDSGLCGAGCDCSDFDNGLPPLNKGAPEHCSLVDVDGTGRDGVDIWGGNGAPNSFESNGQITVMVASIVNQYWNVTPDTTDRRHTGGVGDSGSTRMTVGCSGAFCGLVPDDAGSAVCAPEFNPVTFVPLTDGSTCTDVLGDGFNPNVTFEPVDDGPHCNGGTFSGL